MVFLGGQKKADEESIIPENEGFIFRGFGKFCTLPKSDIDRFFVTYNSLVDVVGEFPKVDE